MTRHLGLAFTDELAQAVADGRKTQTRRPMKPQPPAKFDQPGAFTLHNLDRSRWVVAVPGHHIGQSFVWPPGDEPGIKPHIPGSGIARVGDLLWVRECWMLFEQTPTMQSVNGGPFLPTGEVLPGGVGYRAQIDHCGQVPVTDETGTCWRTPRGPWRPSIHMPKWACRTWARITAVYPERVADISEADAMAEGFDSRSAFLDAYRDIYGSTDGWCWVVAFERCDAPDLSGGGQ